MKREGENGFQVFFFGLKPLEKEEKKVCHSDLRKKVKWLSNDDECESEKEKKRERERET